MRERKALEMIPKLVCNVKDGLATTDLGEPGLAYLEGGSRVWCYKCYI